MQFTKTSSRFYTAVLPSKMVASVRNGGRSRAFSTTQSLYFFDLVRLLMTEQRSTLMTGDPILVVNNDKGDI